MVMPLPPVLPAGLGLVTRGKNSWGKKDVSQLAQFIDRAKAQGMADLRYRGAGLPATGAGRRTSGPNAMASSADRAMLNSARQGAPQATGPGPSDFYSSISDAYDAQIAAIAGLGPLYEEKAKQAQENISSFFGHASDVARAGIPVTQETYDTAQTNVGNIYDSLGSRLSDLPSVIADAARKAGGTGLSDSIATNVAAASAPFVAAGETSRANAVANLTQHSSAGQNYLNQLASATGAEAAMHQSSIEQALNEQMQKLAFQQAELEGAKQMALAKISADVSGSSSERMANAMLSQALGLDLPGEVSPLDFLRASGMMQELQGEEDPETAALRGLSPGVQQAFNDIRRIAESAFNPETDDPRNLGFEMLRILEDMSTAYGDYQSYVDSTDFDEASRLRGKNVEKEMKKRLTGGTLTPPKGSEAHPLAIALAGREVSPVFGSPAARSALERAIRRLYMR